MNGPCPILTQIAAPPFLAGSVPFSIAAEASGKFVYVADKSGGVPAFTVDPATGGLAPIAGSPFAAGTNSISVATIGKTQ